MVSPEDRSGVNKVDAPIKVTSAHSADSPRQASRNSHALIPDPADYSCLRDFGFVRLSIRPDQIMMPGHSLLYLNDAKFWSSLDSELWLRRGRFAPLGIARLCMLKSAPDQRNRRPACNRLLVLVDPATKAISAFVRLRALKVAAINANCR